MKTPHKNWFVIYSTNGDAIDSKSFCTTAPDAKCAAQACILNQPAATIHAVTPHNGKKFNK